MININDYDYEENELKAVAERFETLFPTYAGRITRCKDIGDGETIFYIMDGNKVIFDELENTALYIPPRDSNSTRLSEYEWRREFARKLKRKLELKHMTQKELASLTGISYASLRKYLHEESTPNAYILNKIAEVLKCHDSELIYFSYLF